MFFGLTFSLYCHDLSAVLWEYSSQATLPHCCFIIVRFRFWYSVFCGAYVCMCACVCACGRMCVRCVRVCMLKLLCIVPVLPLADLSEHCSHHQLFPAVLIDSLGLGNSCVPFSCPQAVEDVNRGMLKATDKLYELKALKEQEKVVEVSFCPSSLWWLASPGVRLFFGWLLLSS